MTATEPAATGTTAAGTTAAGTTAAGTTAAGTTAAGTTANRTETIRLRVNGVTHEITVEPRRLLSDALRLDVGLTGTHVGCEHGVCGACTILVDGEPMRACLMFAISAQDYDLTTVEGLTNTDGTLGPVQQAFADCHGLQCGFCTPGFLTTITAGIRDNPEPTSDDARAMIAGNLCRCTGYQNIVAAVTRAAELRRGDTTGETETTAETSTTNEADTTRGAGIR